jgi:hypothetical protein
MLLYVFRPGSGFVATNTSPMRVLWEHLQKRYEFVGISLQKEQLDEFLAANQLPFEVLIFKNYHDPTLKSYGFGASPALYLISVNGKIERAWGGVLVGPTKVDVEAFFGLKLPEAVK